MSKKTQPPAFPSSTPSPPELNPQPSTAQPPALPSSTPSPPQLNLQPSHVRSRRLLELYATPELRHAPIVRLYPELWHASSYGMHRVTATTELRHAPSYYYVCHDLLWGVLGLNISPQKATYTCENCDIFNIFVCGMLKKC